MATELTKENLIEYVKKQKIKIKQLDLADAKKEKELKETKLKLCEKTSQFELLQQQQQQSSISTTPIVSSDISKSISSFSSSFVKDFSKVFSGPTDGDEEETILSPSIATNINDNELIKINEELKLDINKITKINESNLILISKLEDDIKKSKIQKKKDLLDTASKDNQINELVNELQSIPYRCATSPIQSNTTINTPVDNDNNSNKENENIINNLTKELGIAKSNLLQLEDDIIKTRNISNSLIVEKDKIINDLEIKNLQENNNNNELTLLLQASKKNIEELEKNSKYQDADESEGKVSTLEEKMNVLTNINNDLQLQLDASFSNNNENKSKIIELELLLSEAINTNIELQTQLDNNTNKSNNTDNEIGKLNNIINENITKICQFQDQITDISMNNSNLENDNVILESKLESNLKKVDVLNSQLSELESLNNDEIIKLKTEIDSNKRLICSLEEEMACSEADTINEMHVNTVNELHEVIDNIKEELNNNKKIYIEKLEIEQSNIIKLTQELDIYQLKIKSFEELNQGNSLNTNINIEKEKESINSIDELNNEIIKLKLSNKTIQADKESLEIKYLKEIELIKSNLLQKDENIIEINNKLEICQGNLNETKSLLDISQENIIKSENNLKELQKLEVNEQTSLIENNSDTIIKELNNKLETLQLQLDNIISNNNDEIIKLKTEIDSNKRLICSLEEEIACSEVDGINEMHVNTVNELHEVIDNIKESNKLKLDELTNDHQDYINEINDNNYKNIEESKNISVDLKDINTTNLIEIEKLNKLLLEKEELLIELNSAKELLLLQLEKDEVSNQTIIIELENSIKELKIQLQQQNIEIIDLKTVILAKKNNQILELEGQLEESKKIIDDANFDINSRDKDLEDVETQLLELRSNYDEEINSLTNSIEVHKNKIKELEELNQLSVIKETELMSNIDKLQIDLNDMLDNSASSDDKLINIQQQCQIKIDNLEEETSLAREERELHRRRVLELEGLREIDELEKTDIRNEYIIQIEQLNDEITKSNQEKKKLNLEIDNLINKSNDNDKNAILIEELNNKLDIEINKNNEKELKIIEISKNLIEFETKNKDFEISLNNSNNELKLVKEEYENSLLTMSIENDNNDEIMQLNSKLLSSELNSTELSNQIEKLNSILDSNNIESEMKIDALTEKVKRMKVLLTKSKVAAQERENELELLIQSGHRPKRFGIQAR
jgi:hypothetical protein